MTSTQSPVDALAAARPVRVWQSFFTWSRSPGFKEIIAIRTTLHSSGESGLELGLQQDAPLSLRWNLSASYAGIVDPSRGRRQEESQITADKSKRGAPQNGPNAGSEPANQP